MSVGAFLAAATHMGQYGSRILLKIASGPFEFFDGSFEIGT